MKKIVLNKNLFLIITIIIAIFVIGMIGFAGWKYSEEISKLENEKFQPINFSTKEKTEIKYSEKMADEFFSESLSTKDWKTYRNVKHGFEFEYPEKWESINFKSKINDGLYFFSSQNGIIQDAWYYESSKLIIFVIKNTLKIIYPSKEIKTIYTISPELMQQYGEIKNINFSPDGEYVYFIVQGYKNSEDKVIDKDVLMNIDNCLNIIEDYDIWIYGKGDIVKMLNSMLIINTKDINKNIIWSPNNKVLAIRSYFDKLNKKGIDGLFISDYDNCERLNEIFSFNKEERFGGSYIYDLYFVDDNKLSFSIYVRKCKFDKTECSKERIVEYNYFVKTKKLLAKDKMSDWMTYRNKEYGYEIKYPSCWNIIDDNSACENNPHKIKSFDFIRIQNFEKPVECGFSGPGGEGIVIKINVNKRIKSIEEWKKKILKEGGGDEKIKEIENIEIDGIKGKEFYSFCDPAGYAGIPVLSDYYKVVINNNSSYAFAFDASDDIKKIINQILSTFKFIETDDTADWQTYQNKEYGFELKYPENWQGYKIEKEEHDLMARKRGQESIHLGKYTILSFGFPPHNNSLFTILIYTRNQWEKISDDYMRARHLGSTATHVYMLSIAQDVTSEFNSQYNAIKQILSTFKFTE